MKIEQIKNLPSPKGHLILGHLPQFNVSGTAEEMGLQYGKFCQDLIQDFVSQRNITITGNKKVIQARNTQEEDRARRQAERRPEGPRRGPVDLDGHVDRG